jgi:hypothetical protein
MSSLSFGDTAAADAVARAVLYQEAQGASLHPFLGTLTPEGGDGPGEAVTEVLVVADSPEARLRVTLKFLALEPDREESVELADIPLDGEIEHGFVRGQVRGAVIATTSAATLRVRGAVPKSSASSAKLLCAAAARANAGDEKAFTPYLDHLARTETRAPSTHRVRVAIKNEGLGRDEVRAMGAAHVVLAIEKGHFVSSMDPPPELAEEVARCKNEGLFPVLVGTRGASDTMLATPIILYDYPEVAAE